MNLCFDSTVVMMPNDRSAIFIIKADDPDKIDITLILENSQSSDLAQTVQAFTDKSSETLILFKNNEIKKIKLEDLTEIK